MANIAENSSLVSLASTFTRTNGQPIDDSILFSSLTAAQNYAKTDGRAYVGQYISVKNAANGYDGYLISNVDGDLIPTTSELGKSIFMKSPATSGWGAATEDSHILAHGVEIIGIDKPEGEEAYPNTAAIKLIPRELSGSTGYSFDLFIDGDIYVDDGQNKVLDESNLGSTTEYTKYDLELDTDTGKLCTGLTFAAGGEQGTYSVNNVPYNVNGLQTASSPEFVSVTATEAITAKHLELCSTDNDTWGYIDFHSPTDTGGDNDSGRIWSSETGITINRDTTISGNLNATTALSSPTLHIGTIYGSTVGDDINIGTTEDNGRLVVNSKSDTDESINAKGTIHSDIAIGSPDMYVDNIYSQTLASDINFMGSIKLPTIGTSWESSTEGEAGLIYHSRSQMDTTNGAAHFYPWISDLGLVSLGVFKGGGIYELVFNFNKDANNRNQLVWDMQNNKLSCGSYNATSDARLKENFQEFKPEKSILDLPTYKFDFINGAKNQIGCKAQDLQEICPEIVDEGSDGYLNIQESKIVYLLLDEIKKLRKEIDELKSR